MKKLILIVVFFFILKIGYSQDLDYKKNEITLGIFNLTESPKNQDILFSNSYYLVPFSHLTYKRFINKRNVLRLTYYRPINKSYDKSGGDWISKGSYKEQFYKMGYEYRFKSKKLKPYVALDITYFKSSSSSEAGGGFVASFNRLQRKATGFGLSPTFGVNYKIYKRFFIGIESNLNILFLEEDKTTTSTPPLTITFSKDNFTSTVLNPVTFIAIFKF